MTPMGRLHFNRLFNCQLSHFTKRSNSNGITFGGLMMKTLKFTGMAVVLFSTCVLSVQAQGLKDVSFGVKAGMNVASFIGDMSETFENRTAIHIGGFAEFPLIQKISLVPEIVYSMQGSKQGTWFGEDTYKVDYLNIPVMLMFYPEENFSIGIGPQLGILMSAKREVDISGLANSNGSYTLDIKEHVNDFDFSLNFGVGYHLRNGLFFQGRYNLGLSNALATNDNSGYSANVNIDHQNSVFQLSVGYVLGK
jgi:hypothetical protein